MDTKGKGAKGLDACREEINRVDGEILSLLAQRRKLSRNVIEAKDAAQQPFRDQAREEELLIRLIRDGRDKGLDSHFVTSIYHGIIDDSLRLQQEYLHARTNGDKDRTTVQVAFLGIEGSYSHLAATQHFSRSEDRIIYHGCSSFDEVVKSVESGKADCGILPIENTTSGGINEVYDLLLHTQLFVVGEETYKVEHCLVGSEDSELSDIRSIYSHPQALTQTSKFTSSLPNCQIHYCNSTAESVKKVRDSKDRTMAAIASEATAKIFGLKVIRRDVANQSLNFTRFILVGRKPREVDIRIPCKTSLVISTAHQPGSLVEALLVFRNRGLNLTKLESRPVPDNAWEEMFYLDFVGNLADKNVQEGLDELTKVIRFMKVMGSYPSMDIPKTTVPTEALTHKVEPASTNGAAPVEKKKSSKSKGYKLVGRDHKAEDTIITVRGVQLGGPQFVVIAGPCSVESEDQIMVCAREAKENGTAILRGGCFKPRTSPYSFQGLGLDGLDLLAEAGRVFDLPIITEVLAPEDVEPVARKADILQIGARNMQNFSLLKSVGRTHRPVMLKRGLMASIDELLNAAEYILAHGNQQVFLCERGIRTFETQTRNTLDLSAIPILRELTHLPIFVDPSHAVGERDLVPPMAKAAKAAGAHGIMIEFHPEPEKALSDGPQALRFPQFERLMSELFAK